MGSIVSWGVGMLKWFSTRLNFSLIGVIIFLKSVLVVCVRFKVLLGSAPRVIECNLRINVLGFAFKLIYN